MTSDQTKGTDDVSGAASSAEEAADSDDVESTADDAAELDPEAGPLVIADPPRAVAELAGACVRFVATRYGSTLDFSPETLSLLDHWLADARAEAKQRPEVT